FSLLLDQVPEALHNEAEIDLIDSAVEADRLRILQRTDDVGRIDQDLGGYAPVIKTGATRRPLLHEGHLKARIKGTPDDLHPAARSDNDDVELLHMTGKTFVFVVKPLSRFFLD